jgi:two-component system sensor histidine kinase KdpD
MRRRGTRAAYPRVADTAACENPHMSVEQPHRPDWLSRLPWPSAFGHREWYRSRGAATLIAAAGVAASTGVVGLLTPSVPVRSAGVFYLVAVLAISSIYGLWLGLVTSLASAVAYNFFFLPPRHTLTISSSGDWLSLAAFVVTALVTSHLASRERVEAEEAARRAAEAQLGERLATLIATGSRLQDALPLLGRQAARALGARDGGIHLGAPSPAGQADRVVPIELDGRRLGELRLIDAPRGSADSPDAERIGRVLAGLVALGQEREQRLAHEVESEALRRSNELTTALLRTVSHDFRSPLTAISTSAEGLRYAHLDADERELLDTIADQSGRLGRLVTNLLDLSRLEAGAAAPAAEWVDMRDLIDAAVAEVTAASTIAVDVRHDTELPLVRVDAAQLQRVLVNLFENAVKYSPPDDPVVVSASAAGGRVNVAVSDRGPGIPEADRAQIFRPFFRGRTGAEPGSGLGLAIASGLASANGATITLEPADGPGTTVTLSVPASPNVDRRPR